MDLENWTRPYFEPSNCDTNLFYVAYGIPPKDWNLSGSKYRVSGIPDGIEISTCGPEVSPETVDTFRSGYLWDRLLEERPEFASKLSQETECIIIRGALDDQESLNYFRDLVGLIQWLFDSGIQGVFDPHAFLWWSAEEWDEVFQKAHPDPHSHVMIFLSPENGHEWAHTRGMRKFGRPDLSVRGYPSERTAEVGKLINKLIEIQAFGEVIPEEREYNIEGFPPGIICNHKGDLDDPEFNNVHIEIIWPKESGLKKFFKRKS